MLESKKKKRKKGSLEIDKTRKYMCITESQIGLIRKMAQPRHNHEKICEFREMFTKHRNFGAFTDVLQGAC